MELITNPNPEHLLDASLETLHAQSREWVNEIDYWIEEMAFFYNLIHLHEPHIFIPTVSLADLEKWLLSLTSEHLSKLKIEVESHERVLAKMVRNISLEDDREYRERHRSFLAEMYRLEEEIRKFKKSVFFLVN